MLFYSQYIIIHNVAVIVLLERRPLPRKSGIKEVSSSTSTRDLSEPSLTINTSLVTVLSVRNKRQPLGVPKNRKHTKTLILPLSSGVSRFQGSFTQKTFPF